MATNRKFLRGGIYWGAKIFQAQGRILLKMALASSQKLYIEWPPQQLGVASLQNLKMEKLKLSGFLALIQYLLPSLDYFWVSGLLCLASFAPPPPQEHFQSLINSPSQCYNILKGSLLTHACGRGRDQRHLVGMVNTRCDTWWLNLELLLLALSKHALLSIYWTDLLRRNNFEN